MIKCSICNKESVYYNSKDSSELCEEHFCQSFETSVKNNMLEFKNKKIAVYFSGGKDSVVLLYVLKKILNYDIIAITADLGIKNHTEKIIELGKKMCKELDIPFYKVVLKDIINTDVCSIVEKNGTDIACNYCGEIRNIALDLASKELKVDAYASGHNCDDVTRFLLNNYLKNDIFRIVEFACKVFPDTKIKDKIEYENPTQLKPLIYLTEKEITLYSIIKKLEIINSCCGISEIEKTTMQNWRKDLTNSIYYYEDKYPGISIKMINNFEKNILPVFNEMLLNNPDSYKKRQCVFCKEEMKTTQKDIFLICKKCSEKIDLKYVLKKDWLIKI